MTELRYLEAFALMTVFFMVVLMIMAVFLDLSPVVVVGFFVYFFFYGRRMIRGSR